VLRHIAGGRRVVRDEDADVDTAAEGSTTAAVGGACNVDDGLLLKAAQSRRLVRPPPPAVHHSTDTGVMLVSQNGAG